MQTADRPVMPNRAVRMIERWKRGLAMLAVIAVTLLAAAIPAALIGWAASYFRIDEVLAGTFAALFIAPWMFGSRAWMETAGSLARGSDS